MLLISSTISAGSTVIPCLGTLPGTEARITNSPTTLLVRPVVGELTFPNEQADLGVNKLLDSVAFSSHEPQYR